MLRLWVRVPPGRAWMSVCCECCVLSDRGLCGGLIARPEESYRLWCVVVCYLDPLVNEAALAHWGAVTPKKKNKKLFIKFNEGFFIQIYLFIFLWLFGLTLAMASSFMRFLDHTHRRTTVARTALDEWSARRRDLCLKTQNTHNRQTSLPSVGFEPTISTGE